MTSSRKGKEACVFRNKKIVGTIVTLSRKLYGSLRVIKRSLHLIEHAAVLVSCPYFI